MSDVLIVELVIGATNDELIEKMKMMKRYREERAFEHIVACISGFCDDPRELFEIPEVRAFCRRVVNLGLISYLEVATVFDSRIPAPVKTGWGAAEFYWCAENKIFHKGKQFRLRGLTAKQASEEFRHILSKVRSKSEALLGPVTMTDDPESRRTKLIAEGD